MGANLQLAHAINNRRGDCLLGILRGEPGDKRQAESRHRGTEGVALAMLDFGFTQSSLVLLDFVSGLRLTARARRHGDQLYVGSDTSIDRSLIFKNSTDEI